MKKIFKYPIPLNDKFSLDLPVDCTILSFQVQKMIPTLWILIDDQQPLAKQYFSIYGTGHDTDIDAFSVYIGTIQLQSMVWHLFRDIII